ncbi:MAG: hypothetical protein K2K56_05275 [Lachnospiraceae bacterium]|nr:hypothetical protein [Lachnospiraceae bacterium]
MKRENCRERLDARKLSVGELAMQVKRILSCMLMTMCLAVTLCISVNVLEVHAETTTLKAGKTYSLSFAKGTTPHVNYVMPSKGYFYYEVTPTYCTVNGERVNSTFYFNVNMSVNNKILEKDYFIYNGECEKSVKFAFKKGTVVDLSIVDEADTIMEENVVIHYDIKITAVTPKNFEKENNNNKKSANTIKKGKTYTGLIMQNDQDYYVFKAPKTGKYKIQITVSSAEKDVDSLYAEVLKGTKRLGRIDTRYGDGFKTVYNGKLKKGAKLYVKVYGEPPITFSGDLLYKLRVK